MSLFHGYHFAELLQQYGYWVIGVVVGLEAMGVPLPGESLVIAAALYAARSHELSVGGVVATAATGAILGDNLGYLIGRSIGFPLLHRYGRYILLTPERLAVGQRLFERHGGKVVLFGRFVAVLRTLAALLAGASRMHWTHFLLANAIGGIAWASLYGFGTYALGREAERLKGPVGLAAGVIGAGAILVVVLYARRQERRLAASVSQAPRD